MTLQKYRLTKALVISFCYSIATAECIDRQRAAEAVFSSTRYQLDAQAEPSLVCSMRGRCSMQTEFDNRWDLHVKISESPSTKL